MKTSEVLRRVRLHLKYGGEYVGMHRHFICEAINYLYYEAKVIGDRDRTRVKKIVVSMLRPQWSLEDWLDKQHNIECTHTPEYRRKIMATRKAWLTHLIEHYSHKGD